MDGLDRPDIQAARRLDGDDQVRLRLDLAGKDQALEVATRKRRASVSIDGLAMA